MHKQDFAHNNIKPASICIRKCEEEYKVTLTNLGLTMAAGSRPRLVNEQDKVSAYYAPEICERENPGRCSSLSDVYSAGKLLHYLFEGSQMPKTLKHWITNS